MCLSLCLAHMHAKCSLSLSLLKSISLNCKYLNSNAKLIRTWNLLKLRTFRIHHFSNKTISYASTRIAILNNERASFLWRLYRANAISSFHTRTRTHTRMYTHTHTHTHMHTHTHTQTHTHQHTHTYIHTYTHTHTHTHKHTYVHTLTHTHTYMYIHTHTHTNTNTNTNTHTHTHTHTHTRIHKTRKANAQQTLTQDSKEKTLIIFKLFCDHENGSKSPKPYEWG